jgi:N-ethylmaleimide reductase
LHASFGGKYIANNGYDGKLAIEARLRRDLPFTEPNKATFYGGGAPGYADSKALTDPATS